MRKDLRNIDEGRCTVNSRYCGHFRDRDLVSVLERVRNSAVREKVLENVFMGRVLFILTALPTRDVFARTKGIVI